MRRPLALVVASAALACAGAIGCTAVLGIDSTTLATDASVDGGAPEAGADWTCVGKVQEATPTVDAIDITVNVADFATGVAPTGTLQVKACASKTDNVCATPVATASSDAKGVAVVHIPLANGRGFSGYLEVTGTNYVRYLWYFSRPLVASRSFPLNVLTDDTLTGLLANFGISPPDDTRGHLAVNTTDCQDVDAPGVQISVDNADAKSKRFYFSDGLLSDKMTETQKGYALGGYFNLPTGTATVSATPTATGVVMGQNTIIIAPHTLTTIRLLPN